MLMENRQLSFAKCGNDAVRLLAHNFFFFFLLLFSTRTSQAQLSSTLMFLLFASLVFMVCVAWGRYACKSSNVYLLAGMSGLLVCSSWVEMSARAHTSLNRSLCSMQASMGSREGVQSRSSSCKTLAEEASRGGEDRPMPSQTTLTAIKPYIRKTGYVLYLLSIPSELFHKGQRLMIYMSYACIIE